MEADPVGASQSNTSSNSPNSLSVHRTVSPLILPLKVSTPSFIFHCVFCSSVAFQFVRSTPVNSAFQSLSTSQISLGFGLVVGSSLILRFLKRHSEPSDSRAR